MKISVDKSRNLCEVLLSAADIYIEKFYTGGAILLMKHSAGSHVVYRFDWPMRTYFFPWVRRIFDALVNGHNGADTLYITDAQLWDVLEDYFLGL